MYAPTLLHGVPQEVIYNITVRRVLDRHVLGTAYAGNVVRQRQESLTERLKRVMDMAADLARELGRIDGGTPATRALAVQISKDAAAALYELERHNQPKP